MTGKPRSTHVRCRICGQLFIAVTGMHLRLHAGLDPLHPVRDYKKRFRLKVACAEVLRRHLRWINLARWRRLGCGWSRSRVVAEIRRRVAAGMPLNASAVEPATGRNASLAPMARHFFGSWGAAVEEAGFDYDSIRKVGRWNRDRVVDHIRARAATGEPPNAGWAAETSPGLYKAASRLFGSWDRALRAVGLKPRRVHRRRDWNRDSVLDALRRRVAARRPLFVKVVLREDPSLYHAVRNYLGSWKVALSRIGVAYEPAPRPRRRRPASGWRPRT